MCNETGVNTFVNCDIKHKHFMSNETGVNTFVNCDIKHKHLMSNETGVNTFVNCDIKHKQNVFIKIPTSCFLLKCIKMVYIWIISLLTFCNFSVRFYCNKLRD